MKNINALIKGLFLAATIATITQATDTNAAQTNAVQFINVQLTLLTQGDYETNKPATNEISATVQKTTITTKDIISWLGTATTNTFSGNAKLVRVKHFNASTNETTIEIRDGTNAPVDVTAFFANSTSAITIDESIVNTATGLVTGKQFEVFHLVLTNAPNFNLVPHFHAAGLAVINFAAVRSGNTVLIADEIKARNLAGSGRVDVGDPGIVTGSLTLNGTVREVK
jgi:hypothetical protein